MKDVKKNNDDKKAKDQLKIVAVQSTNVIRRRITRVLRPKYIKR